MRNDKKSWIKRHPIWSVIIGFFLLFILIGIFSGNKDTNQTNTSNQNTAVLTNREPKISPSEVAEDWTKALIKGSSSEKVFNYLNQDVKSKYNSYDEWNDELYNMKYSWNIQGLYFTFIEVKNETILGDTASVNVKYQTSGIIQKTVTQKYEFIKVGDEWKLKEYYELTLN